MNEQDAVERLLDKNRERLKHNSEGASAYAWREYLKETNAQLQAQRKEIERLLKHLRAAKADLSSDCGDYYHRFCGCGDKAEHEIVLALEEGEEQGNG